MGRDIFISYRRDDEPGMARALYNELERVFSEASLFMDVEGGIPPGRDFVRIIEDQVSQCQIMLAIVGRGWLAAADEDGRKRLDNPDDFVRIEIESAMRLGKLVIPVVLNKTEPVRAADLPEPMKQFARLHALRLTHERFKSDTQGLIKAVQQALAEFETIRTAEQERIRQEAQIRKRAEEEANQNRIRIEKQRAIKETPEEVDVSKVRAGRASTRLNLAIALQLFFWNHRWRLAGLALFSGLVAVVVAIQPSPYQQPAVTTPPLVRNAGAPPVVQQAAAPPAVQQATAPPAVQQATAPPAVQQAAAPPAAQSLPRCGTLPRNVSFTTRAANPLTTAEECALKPKDSFKECDKCPQMVVLPAGSFTMGSDDNSIGSTDNNTLIHPKPNEPTMPGLTPAHTVTIPKLFAVGKFEVTVREYAVFANETGYDGSKCFMFDSTAKDFKLHDQNSWRNPGYQQSESHPVACINWSDAKAYVAWLSRTTGKRYRLLSEAEWEYAARAGTQTSYYFGDDSGLICEYANGADQTYEAALTPPSAAPPAPSTLCRDRFVYTAPAGSFLPNEFGLYDMYGNVWETVEDCANEGYSGAPTDGTAWLSGDCSRHIRRGGSFFLAAPILTSVARFGGVTNDRVGDVGFRVARTLDPR
jgi:formylglycine-generating enzyme required for sulfatase activity